jgi:hypothetical protein
MKESSMTFKVLSQIINEDEDITAGVAKIAGDLKTGYNTAKSKHQFADFKNKDIAAKAQAEVDKQKKDAEDAINKQKAQQTAQDKQNSLDAVAKAKDEENQDKVNAKQLADNFLNQFFDNFPNYGSDIGPEYISQNLKTRAGAVNAFKTFKNLANKVDDLTKSMNTSLVGQRKITTKQSSKFQDDAEKIAESGKLPEPLEKFAQKEASFFKKLFRIDDDFKLDDNNFKSLLSAKMKTTAEDRVADAAQALNILFAYTSAQLNAFAKTIADAGRRMPK